MPVNWSALAAFLAASSQWRLAGSGAVIGLDYAGATAAWASAGLTVTPTIFSNVRIMESAAVEALAEQRKRTDKRANNG